MSGDKFLRDLHVRRGGRWRTQASPVKVYRDGELDVQATRKAYYDYISDPWWARRRARNVADECAACGSTNNLHVHHRTYKHVGFERPWELVTLCSSCHASLHHYQRRSGLVLAVATSRFIDQKRRDRGVT